MKQDTRTTAEAYGNRNMTNGKPYRTAEQKSDARASAEKIDGRWVSRAPKSYHQKAKGK